MCSINAAFYILEKQKDAEREAKKKEKKNHKIQTLTNDIEKIKAMAEKEQEILDNLKEYKNFIDKIGVFCLKCEPSLFNFFRKGQQGST